LDGYTPLTFAGKPSTLPADFLRSVSYCRELVRLPVAA